LTIIFNGPEFWIEQLQMTFTIPDAAGETTSGSVALQKSGTLLGVAATFVNGDNNDNTQAIGNFDVRTNAGLPAVIGNHAISLNVRVHKELGTAGATSVTILVLAFVRASGT